MNVRVRLILLRAAEAAPHALLVAVSAVFTAVFFRALGRTGAERAIYLALASALEAAKVHFLWHRSSSGIRRVGRVAMVSILAAFSVAASLSFSLNALGAEGARFEAIADSGRAYERLIRQTGEQIDALQEKLETLPREWRLTKNEYVEQLSVLRAEQERLIELRSRQQTLQADVIEDRAGFWLLLSEALDLDEQSLLIAAMLALAVVLELSIVGTRPKRADEVPAGTQPPAPASREASPQGDEEPTLEDFARAVLTDTRGSRPKSLRDAAKQFGISKQRAQGLHMELRGMGVLATHATHTVQVVTRSEALSRIALHRAERAA